jgi:hypothetical protein
MGEGDRVVVSADGVGNLDNTLVHMALRGQSDVSLA